jgi:hypothetical protein
MPKLIYHDSDGVDKVIMLGAEPLLIGRATECQIQTQDAMVSRRHARIVWDGNYWIEDLGSSNGVYVGNERVQRAPFRPGDTVTCGSLVLKLVPDTAPRTTSQANLGMTLTPAPPPMSAPPAAPPPPAANVGVSTGKSPALRDGSDLEVERKKRAEAESALEVAAREINALKRKVDQLSADLRRIKSGGTLDGRRDEADSQMLVAAIEERDKLKLQVQELTRRLAGASTAKPAGGAPTVDPAAADTVILLSDALAELRASLRAANGEATLLKEPAESAQVVVDSLKSAAEQLEAARTNVRALAKLLGVG